MDLSMFSSSRFPTPTAQDLIWSVHIALTSVMSVLKFKSGLPAVKKMITFGKLDRSPFILKICVRAILMPADKSALWFKRRRFWICAKREFLS